jgi:hypothetical protein
MEQEVRTTKVQAANRWEAYSGATQRRLTAGPGNRKVLTDQFVPPLCHVEMSGGRAIWTQTRSNDGVNLNLVASAAATGG